MSDRKENADQLRRENKQIETSRDRPTRCLYCRYPIPNGSLCRKCADSEVGDDWADTVLNSQGHGFPHR